MEKPLLTEAINVIIAENMYDAKKIVEEKDKEEENKEKTQDLDNKVIEANQELTEALADSFREFNKESEEEIIECEKSISDFKAKMLENKTGQETQLVWLEQKVSDLKKMLLSYKELGQENWKSFKTEFNLEMDDLEKALKHFTINKNRQLVKATPEKPE